MSTTTSSNPYTIFDAMPRAGWKRDFDKSKSGFLVVPVTGAPPIGSCPGDLLFCGHFTKPDGASIFMRSNMDASETVVVFGPYGQILHTIHTATLAEAGDAIDKLNII
jgi:hypothetical protein